ncbi:SWIM zinc finger family protein, partial [Hymenobacter coccineus]|uniref:SWIM zinc finger family protein n=1 Tax=Hymenobacter coccineus TaxID=1908235 RepID=UPI000AB23837
MFTRQTLRRLANDNSYQRGEAYYDEGQVEKLRREGTGFAATVRGSLPYRVALHRGPAGPEFSCNCPYDFDGICKHKVALGLAVLDAYGTELDDLAAPAETAPPLADRALATAIKAAWADRKKGDRLRFLKQALAKNDDLARQFLAFGQPPAPPADPLAGLPARLTDTLEVLDFDEDFWENSEFFYEDDEGDGLQEAADELLRDALGPFAAELLHLARGGQLVGALRYWATACGALAQLEEPASDDFGLFDGYGEAALHQWYAVLATVGWPDALLAAVLPPAELAAGLAWLAAHLADPPARWPGFEASWQPLPAGPGRR